MAVGDPRLAKAARFIAAGAGAGNNKRSQDDDKYAVEIEELVALALHNDAPDSPLGRDALHLGDSTPFSPELVSSLGWIIASAIVTAFHADYGMDAIPRYDPQRGWAGFHLTRRIPRPGSSPVVVGAININSGHAPSIVMADAAEPIAVGDTLLSNPAPAISTMLDGIRPPDPLGVLGHQPSWEQQRLMYPRIYRAATELFLAHPRLIIARELFVDDQTIGGAFHPLFLHSDGDGPRLTYDWVLIQMGERCVFIRTHGGRVIYERDTGVWATSSRGLAGESVPPIKRRIADWLQLDRHSGVGAEGDPSPGLVGRKRHGVRRPGG
jgi:hypothetical protein